MNLRDHSNSLYQILRWCRIWGMRTWRSSLFLLVGLWGRNLTTEKGKRLCDSQLVLLYVIRLGRTFACVLALNPLMIYVLICITSTVLEPSTAGSATTDSAGYRKRATLWTHYPTEDRGGAD